MQLPKLIETVKEEIKDKIKPISIFFYGSYQSQDFLPGVSDIEIGVIKSKYKNTFKVLKRIAEKYSTESPRLRIYPYELEELKNLTLDSPFTKSVFTRRLILTSKTIWGQKIVQNLPLPSITLLDAYREACFSTMRALSGLFFLRIRRLEEASEMAYKACLFATASLEYLLGEFPVTFKNIVEISGDLGLDKEWKNLIEFAYQLRQNKIKPSQGKISDFIFKVMTYCNQIVEKRIKKELEKGNRIIIN